MYAYRVAKYVGAYAGPVWPLDALVFTGGIGEKDAAMRDAICARLPQLGLSVDPQQNAEMSTAIVRSIRGRAVAPDVLVIRADEELQIARETMAVIAA